MESSLTKALVALQIQFGIRQQRLIALQVALHLLQGGFVGARIDLRQRIARRARFGLR